MGGTVSPVIISTDKTQLTQFSGRKSAYPVYLTIGNIPKGIRRRPSKNACILIAYLSVEKINRTEMNMSDQEHRIRVQRVFHEAMRVVLEPLIKAGNEGVEMTSSDGSVRDVFPLLSCYVADYPKQCLVTCSKYGTCVKCRAKASELGNEEPDVPRTQSWTHDVIREASIHCRDSPENLRARHFHTYCMERDVAGTVHRPFWEGFPLCNINQAMTPDVLHQLYQGVFKHLVAWCQKAVGAKNLDAQIRALPPAYGLRHFKNGISALSQISGSERKNMAKILLGCLIGIMPKEAIKAVTALLDFIYIAQYEAHDDITLGYLDDALKRFFQHREYFIKINVREHFHIPKFHALLHYVESITLFGTTDNYNTEMFERLHIDFAKNGFRASNKRDEFPQMTRWLSRQERLSRLETHQRTSSSSGDISMEPTPTPGPTKSTTSISISKHPTYPKCKIDVIREKHNAPDFDHYLKLYVNSRLPESQPRARISDIDTYNLPFDKLDVYNLFRFHPTAINDDDSKAEIVKALWKSRTHPQGQFDTVVVLVGDSAESTGVEGTRLYIRISLVLVAHIKLGTRIGRIRVIFSFPDILETTMGPRERPSSWHKEPLAFIEWYSPTPASADENQGLMYRITKTTASSTGRVQGAIVPLRSIRQSCMLSPSFGRGAVPKDWRTDTVLDMASTFFINNWNSKYAYQTIW